MNRLIPASPLNIDVAAANAVLADTYSWIDGTFASRATDAQVGKCTDVLLTALARIRHAPRPRDPLARCFQDELMEKLVLFLRPVAGHETVAAWLPKALTLIRTGHSTREQNQEWSHAAIRATGAVLSSVQDDRRVSGRSVSALVSSINSRLRSLLVQLDDMTQNGH